MLGVSLSSKSGLHRLGTLRARLCALRMDMGSESSVFQCMFLGSHGFKVFGAVVVSRAVDVMDVLIRSQIATVSLLPIHSMFRNISLRSGGGMLGSKHVDIALGYKPFRLGIVRQLGRVGVVASDVKPRESLPSIAARNILRRNSRLPSTTTKTESMSGVVGRGHLSPRQHAFIEGFKSRLAFELMPRNKAPGTPLLGFSFKGLIASTFANSHASIIQQGVSA